jgi:hypothetical protein
MAVMNESAELRKELRRELEPIIRRLNARTEADSGDKAVIRADHADHRRDRARAESDFVSQNLERLLPSFANADDVRVDKISPKIELVHSDSDASHLFRLATLLWSVPVSRGYGRRLRFLVRDVQNDKLIGIMALGDPVFNLRARDEWIGWDVRAREKRLCNVMDAYVLGAVPPYSHLIGGKLVAALVASREIHQLFAERYGNREGIISQENRRARLALITTTSSLGRSSIYNRLKIGGRQLFQPIGFTGGWGHYHLDTELFQKMRRLLELVGHEYADGYKYGSGPNWKMRVIRGALEEIGVDHDVLRHGIKREVFAVPLARNAQAFLRGDHCRISRWETHSASDIAEFCVNRWLLPRFQRDGTLFTQTTRASIGRQLQESVSLKS